MQGERYSHYAVRVGKVPGIYSSWEECAPHVLGHSGAQYRGFKSLGNALDYMNRVHEKKKNMWSPQGGEKMARSVVNAGVGSPKFSPASSVLDPVRWSFRAEAQGGGFLMVEDMEVYLMRACVKLVMGCPVFEPRWFISPQGERMVGYSASLRCEEKGVYLQVESSYCGDDGHARQEAAYLLLDQLLRRIGYTICDFNYRRLCEAEEQIRQSHGPEDVRVAQRLLELEAKCKKLSTEVENYHKHLGL
ncbi:hypothetical protein PIB30_064993 [Stylosanthes scabra]|uniref:Ribonuclease H1 N-terminal domain-containing protein n=1 Tax=Stylosanthes scabra TaxID=79078 RepID=A0ABU6QNW8_9FABA|nr:hypothetical protein [Stylosanthes scabra]